MFWHTGIVGPDTLILFDGRRILLVLAVRVAAIVLGGILLAAVGRRQNAG